LIDGIYYANIPLLGGASAIFPIHSMSNVAYPRDLAAFILDHWDRRAQAVACCGESHAPAANPWDAPPPSRESLERLIINCYQASLLREELRPVTFRLILAEPELFPHEQGPPDGLHCLRFSQTRPFNPLETKRLSPAANFYRSLIGVCLDEKKDSLRIWGIIHSGLRWLQNVHGGRGRVQTLPPALVLSVTGPGRLTIGFGSEVIGRLEGGQITGPSLNIFDSDWLSHTFEKVRAELHGTHDAARRESGAEWARLDPKLIRVIAQHALKRVISALRSSHHGATILLLPSDLTDEAGGFERFIDLKYRFAEGEPRQRFRSLIVRIMNRVAELHTGSDQEVGWEEYALSNDEKLAAFDEAIFEMAYLIAGCAEVDGAVVLSSRFELLGFGGEISGELPGVVTVRRALDLEGKQAEDEFTESVGTRHRSAYRLCLGLPQTLAIVISQDGAVRFVTKREGAVTYWDQLSTTSLDV
jgi:hypothetical protein